MSQADSSTVDKVPHSKITEIFPLKIVGIDKDGLPIYKRVCLFCPHITFSRQSGESSSNIGKHLRQSCPGMICVPHEGDKKDQFPFQFLFHHPTLKTKDLLELKAQKYFDDTPRIETFKRFKEELDKKAKEKGLSTPEKKVGNTPKQNASVGKLSRIKKIGTPRTLSMPDETEGSESEIGNNKKDDNESTEMAAEMPKSSQDLNIMKKLEDMEATFESQLNKIRVELLYMNQQMHVNQSSSKSSKKKTEPEEVTGSADDSKKLDRAAALKKGSN